MFIAKVSNLVSKRRIFGIVAKGFHRLIDTTRTISLQDRKNIGHCRLHFRSVRHWIEFCGLPWLGRICPLCRDSVSRNVIGSAAGSLAVLPLTQLERRRWNVKVALSAGRIIRLRRNVDYSLIGICRERHFIILRSFGGLDAKS